MRWLTLIDNAFSGVSRIKLPAFTAPHPDSPESCLETKAASGQKLKSTSRADIIASEIASDGVRPRQAEISHDVMWNGGVLPVKEKQGCSVYSN